MEALAADAALVVGDDYPAGFQPAMQYALADRLDVAHELVDSATLVPMATAPGKVMLSFS